ncbi:MAG: protoporphyrinogen oxidase [Bacteroidales bacterium]|jgi:oxygen-dependent protoporphyrinogen oxidase|nr:protoporphyrinogen oxidase [Bacteroidales bacterium]
MKQPRIAILGAGLTGLSTGYFLSEKGLQADILEKQNHIGGVMQSKTEKGFTYELGPNTGVLNNIYIEELFQKLRPDCTLEIASEQAKKRLILKNNKWHPLPYNFSTAVSTPLFTLKDKFRILGEPFRKAGTAPHENLYCFVNRRLGKSFHDYAVAPFINGVYAGNTQEIITKYALPKLYNLEQEYGSLIKGSIQKQKKKLHSQEPKPSKQIFSCKNGLTHFISALEKNQNSTIHTGCSDIFVSKKNNEYVLTWKDAHNTPHEEIYDTIIYTIPAYALGSTCTFLSDSDRKVFNAIPYAPIVQISLGFKHWDGIDINAFGGLCPPKEKRNILGVLFMSSMFSDKAPNGGALFAAFAGGRLNQEICTLSDEEITKIVLHECKELLQYSKTPDLIRIHRYSHAIAQYTTHQEKVIETCTQLEESYPNMHFTGGYINGISIGDRVKQGFETAKHIYNSL